MMVSKSIRYSTSFLGGKAGFSVDLLSNCNGHNVCIHMMFCSEINILFLFSTYYKNSKLFQWEVNSTTETKVSNRPIIICMTFGAAYRRTSSSQRVQFSNVERRVMSYATITPFALR